MRPSLCFEHDRIEVLIMARYIDADKIEPFINREEWDTPDERWRPESEFGRFVDAIPTADVQPVIHGHWVKVINKEDYDTPCE